MVERFVTGEPAGSVRRALHQMLIGKSRHHGAGLGVRVGVVEMVMRITAVEPNSLLDQPLAHDSGEEIDILLRAAGARREVVNS
jgi:hypothetical protein